MCSWPNVQKEFPLSSGDHQQQLLLHSNYFVMPISLYFVNGAECRIANPTSCTCALLREACPFFFFFELWQFSFLPFPYCLIQWFSTSDGSTEPFRGVSLKKYLWPTPPRGLIHGYGVGSGREHYLKAPLMILRCHQDWKPLHFQVCSVPLKRWSPDLGRIRRKVGLMLDVTAC